jgi:hypothetical protein
MDTIRITLIDFQIMLVSALVEVTGLGIGLVGLGLVVSGASRNFGYRLQRLGLQTFGACLFVIISHAIMMGYYGYDVPLGLLVALYGLCSLLLLHTLLNLLFGPTVGNRVIASLVGSLLLTLLYLLLRPFGAVRDLFR